MIELIENLINTHKVFISTCKNITKNKSLLCTKSGYVFAIRHSSIVHITNTKECIVMSNYLNGLKYKNKNIVKDVEHSEDVHIIYDTECNKIATYKKDCSDDEVFQYEVLFGFNVRKLYDIVEFLYNNDSYISFDGFINHLTPEENIRELNEAMYVAIMDMIENEIY